MRRRLAALIMCLAFLTITSSLFAEDVYITKQGKKYHESDCRFVTNRDTQKISLDVAKTKGLEPCSRCFGKTEKMTKKVTKSDKNEGLAYITKSGKRYHKSECRLIKNKNTTGISIGEAKAKGLAPCSKCFLQKQAKAK